MPSKILEQLFSPLLKGPLTTQANQTNGWAGTTTLGSGQTSVTVSTTMVNSDSLVFLSSKVGSVSAVASNQGAMVVNSVVSGTSFAITRANGQSAPWGTDVMWMIHRTT